jgi:S-adenosylmethionine:tRNA ribosyltransferase-isomerase
VSRVPESLPVSAFDYSLPADRIARYPAARRDESRLLVLDRATGRTEHRIFHELPGYIPPGDALVLNETRVLPARLLGRKATGAAAEVLLLRPVRGRDDVWEALVRPGAKLRPGSRVEIAPDLSIDILEVNADGSRVVRLCAEGGVAEAIARHGRVPLPPYIDREPVPEDAMRYQTVYARQTGSVAAPTAGLHFTSELLETIAARGVHIVRIVLHVGPGTFRPVEVEDPALHPMHAESYEVPADSANTLNRVRARGGQIWAAGTTVVRTLETVAGPDGTIGSGEGETTLFIRPPYRFRAVDHLITNFHLPRSTLLMLVAAFGGYDAVMAAYREAIAMRYRFFSYGDAMLVV